MLEEYQKEKLAKIGKRIMDGGVPSDCGWHRKGIIVTDDPTGVMLADIKKALDYNALVAAGKVNEISVSRSYPLNSFDECWKTLYEEAQKVPDGLLHIWVNDIKLFEYCWTVKQLAKQEDVDLHFKGYVLIVVKFDKWEEVKKYAEEHNKGEFDAMRQFYDLF